MSFDWAADLEKWASSRAEATTADALAELGRSPSRLNEMRAATALRALGFTRRRYLRLEGGVRAYVYQRPDQVAPVATLRKGGRASLPGATRSPAPTSDPEWRQLRARVGGLERAIAEVQQQRDTARARVRELEAEKYKQSRLDVDPEVVALRLALEHAFACADSDCDTCREGYREIKAARPRYEREAELVEALNGARIVFGAGAVLLAAERAQGVGAAQRRFEARRAFAAAVEGNLSGAAVIVAALGG